MLTRYPCAAAKALVKAPSGPNTGLIIGGAVVLLVVIVVVALLVV